MASVGQERVATNTNQPGVWGENSGGGSASVGVLGTTAASPPINQISAGVWGYNGLGTGAGVFGSSPNTYVGVIAQGNDFRPSRRHQASSTTGNAIYASANSSSGTIYSTNNNASGYGLWGNGNAASGNAIGVFGTSNSPVGIGVYGSGGSGAGVGVFGTEPFGNVGIGVEGSVSTTPGFPARR